VPKPNSNFGRRDYEKGASDLAVLCEPVARLVWGEPSKETPSELRWGTHGSRVVDRANGVWYDHERGVGGGTLDLVPGATKKDHLQWLRDHSLISNARSGVRQGKNGGRKPFTIVATYDTRTNPAHRYFKLCDSFQKPFASAAPMEKAAGLGHSAKHAACSIACLRCGMRSLAAAWCLSWRVKMTRTIYASSGS